MNNNNNNIKRIKHVKRLCFCCYKYGHLRKSCPFKPLIRQYWIERMFNVDLTLAVNNNSKWTPAQVINYYNSDKVYQDYNNVKACKDYLQDQKYSLNQVKEINQALQLKLLTFNFPGSSQVASEKQEQVVQVQEDKVNPVAALNSIKKDNNSETASVSNATTMVSSEPTFHVESRNQVDSVRQDDMAQATNLVEISEKPAENEIREYKQEDFVSYDAYFDYLEEGDLSGLIPERNKKMVQIEKELKKEENYLVNQKATITQLLEAGRKMWEKQTEKEQFSEFKKGFFKSFRDRVEKEEGYKMLRNLGVPEIDILRYEAEEKFPLTSYIGQYDSYTPAEVDALSDNERIEAHWERSPLGFANQVLVNSQTMWSRINNFHDEMYIP